MTLRAALFCGCLAVLGCAEPGAAQGTFTLALSPRTLVRLESADAPGERVVGRVTASTPDTLRLQPGGGPEQSFAVERILSLEVRGGHDRPRGALIGAAAGVGLTLVFGGIDAARGEMDAEDVASVAVGNGLIFALLGYAFAPAGWERLPLPAR